MNIESMQFRLSFAMLLLYSLSLKSIHSFQTVSERGLRVRKIRAANIAVDVVL
jgi:hypothetical protein